MGCHNVVLWSGTKKALKSDQVFLVFLSEPSATYFPNVFRSLDKNSLHIFFRRNSLSSASWRVETLSHCRLYYCVFSGIL